MMNRRHSKNKRLIIAVPLFVVGYIVSKVDFSILWRYFTWANQTTAMVMLWTAAAVSYTHLCLIALNHARSPKLFG